MKFTPQNLHLPINNENLLPILFRSMSTPNTHLGPHLSPLGKCSFFISSCVTEPQITFSARQNCTVTKLKIHAKPTSFNSIGRRVRKPHWGSPFVDLPQKRNRTVYTGVRYNKLSSGGGSGAGGTRTTRISIPADGDDLLEPIVNNSEDDEDDDDDEDEEDENNTGGRGDHVYHDDDHELHDGAAAVVATNKSSSSSSGHSSRQSRFVATGQHGASRRGTRPQPDSIRFART